ncbi:MAG TPA: efflux RND transporter periplasmic adaptor subunit [Xanthobacteraceae bacterium]|jgi:RND family efflux transporter MFP subunit
MTQSRIIAVLILVAAAAGAVYWYLGRPIAVTAARVERGNAAEIVYATGAIEPVRWAKVTPLVKGRIVERCRCEGKEVKAGDVLARLDDKEAQATLIELKARENFDRRELERQTELMARNVTTGQAFERATSELMRTRALISAQAERLQNYKLVAPMDGVVLREDGEIGEIVDSVNVLYRIGLPKPLQVVAEVNEEDIPRVRNGMKVLLRTDAFPNQPLEGTVSDITPAGDPIAKTYRVKIALPDDTPLRIGMSVEANIVTREKADVLLVPSAAVADGHVFVVDGFRAYRRKVETGIRGTRAVEIASGLKEGDLVIASVPTGLADGARVSVTAAAGAK